MDLQFYDLELNEQMMVSCLEDYHGIEFKRALAIYTEYRDAVRNLKFSAEENVEIMMRAKNRKVSGAKWLAHIQESIRFMKSLPDKNGHLKKIDKINQKYRGAVLDINDLDYFEQDIVGILMIAYLYSFEEAMHIMNQYLLEFYEQSDYYTTQEEWAIYLNCAYENKMPLKEAVKEH